MTQVKTAVLSLLVDAYQRRDKVAVVTFSRDRGQILLPATGSVELARARLDAAATGGRTPLAEGLTVAGDLLRRERAKDPMRAGLCWSSSPTAVRPTARTPWGVLAAPPPGSPAWA